MNLQDIKFIRGKFYTAEEIIKEGASTSIHNIRRIIRRDVKRAKTINAPPPAIRLNEWEDKSPWLISVSLAERIFSQFPKNVK